MPRPAFNKDVIDREQWLQTLDLKLLRQLAVQRGISNCEKMDHAQLVKILTEMNITTNPLSTPKTDIRTQ
jgi:hypothetical protein